MEEADEPYFVFSATLRIHGEALDLSEITRSMGLVQTHTPQKRASHEGPVGSRIPTMLGTTVQNRLKRRRWMITYKSFGRMWPQRETSC